MPDHIHSKKNMLGEWVRGGHETAMDDCLMYKLGMRMRQLQEMAGKKSSNQDIFVPWLGINEEMPSFICS